MKGLPPPLPTDGKFGLSQVDRRVPGGWSYGLQEVEYMAEMASSQVGGWESPEKQDVVGGMWMDVWICLWVWEMC